MTKPQQRVPMSVKMTEEWQHANIRYLYQNCTGRNLSKAEIAKLYRMAAGYLDQGEYLFVTDPLGVKNRKELSGNPAGDMINMDIISPILMLLMGEKTKRPNQYQCFAKNSDFPSQKSQRQFEEWIKNIHVMFVNEMIKLGVYVPGQTDQQGQPVQEPDSPEEMEMKMSSIQDWMAIQGQEALDYIRYFNELDRNFRKGFYDWLCTASVYSYKDVRYDDTIYEIVPVHEIEFIKGETDFLEDGQAVKRIQYKLINQVVDDFRDLEGMTDDILDDLERYGKANTNTANQKMFSATETFYNRMFPGQTSIVSNGDNIEVCHFVWKSFQKVKIVSGSNVMGQDYEEVIYDEDYVPLEGEKVRESWHGQNWEGYMLGGKHIVGVRPIPISRTSMSNESVTKLPYNGRVMHGREVLQKSAVAKLEVFQKTINTQYHFLRKVMNKNKDKMTILPLSMIPDKPGWDELTTLYYADATGFLFVDDSDPRIIQGLQYIKTLDASLNQYIESIGRMIISTKQEAKEMLGINRQREGESLASSTATGNQQDMIQSVTSTEELFVEYDEFEEKELQGLMDISKYAFIKGKKATYISSDGKLRYLEIVPESYQNSDFGVFVKNGGAEAAKLREFKQSAFAFAQNQMKPSLVAKIVDTDNLTKLVIELTKAEQELEQNQQAAQQALQQQEQAQLMKEAQEADDKLNFGYYKVDADNLTKREIALIAPPSSPDGTAVASMNQQTEREWQELERDKVLLKTEAEKYRADKSVEVAKISAKNKPKA